MIEFKRVSFKYGEDLEKYTLRDIDFKVSKGEVVLISGESGCGKTTLIRLINGLIPNYYKGKLEGQILLSNKDLLKEMSHQEISNQVGNVFQNPRSQFYCMDTNSELVFESENRGLDIDIIESRMKKVVFDLKMETILNRSIFKLSGGEKQKIACGCVSMISPDIVLLDEPSSNLDIEATKNLSDIISIWKKEGKTIIISEHRIYYLRNIADRILYMKDGKILEDTSIKNFFNSNFSFKKQLRLLDLSDLSPRESEKNSTGRVKLEKENIKIKASNFRYSYKGSQNTLDLEDFEFPGESVVGIIGKNGAGKSTFARCICGLNRGFKGKLAIGNKIHSGKRLCKVGYLVMQDVNHQLFTESVLDEVALSMDNQDESKALDIIKSLGLETMSSAHPMSLSGGQKQRVAIASAIASDREIIVFDEPTSGLDLKNMISVSGHLKFLKERRKTVLVITHDIELIQRACDHVIHIKDGKIEENYSVEEKNINDLFKRLL